MGRAVLGFVGYLFVLFVLVCCICFKFRIFTLAFILFVCWFKVWFRTLVVLVCLVVTVLCYFWCITCGVTLWLVDCVTCLRVLLLFVVGVYFVLYMLSFFVVCLRTWLFWFWFWLVALLLVCLYIWGCLLIA